MQKHVHLLKSGRKRGRNGFALIAAVFLMLIISLLLIKMISNTTENAQQVVNDYLYDQAELLAYGATEYTMLQISATDMSRDCVTNLTMNYPNSGTPFFTIKSSVKYIWDAASIPAGCAAFQTVQTPEQNGTAIIDVVVESNNANLGIDEKIRFTRRTIQKL